MVVVVDASYLTHIEVVGISVVIRAVGPACLFSWLSQWTPPDLVIGLKVAIFSNTLSFSSTSGRYTHESPSNRFSNIIPRSRYIRSKSVRKMFFSFFICLFLFKLVLLVEIVASVVVTFLVFKAIPTRLANNTVTDDGATYPSVFATTVFYSRSLDWVSAPSITSLFGRPKYSLATEMYLFVSVSRSSLCHFYRISLLTVGISYCTSLLLYSFVCGLYGIGTHQALSEISRSSDLHLPQSELAGNVLFGVSLFDASQSSSFELLLEPKFPDTVD